MILFSGRIWCPIEGDLTALAVQDGTIVATGDEAIARARAAAGPVERVVVDDGGILLPAFGDGHAHPMFGGLAAEGPPIRPETSVAGIVARVAEWAAAHPEAEWITGATYDTSLAPGALFDARWLDEAVPDRPVMLRARDFHTVWVNSVALARAGITDATPDPVLGEIPHRADGSVLGTLREWGAVELVAGIASSPDLEDRVRSLERAARTYTALGVTWVQDAWVGPGELEAYLAAAGRGRLPIAFNLALYADPRRWPGQLESLREQRRRVQDLHHPDLTADTVKFFADGIIESETAAVLAPYDGHPPHSGMLAWDPDALADAVTAVDAAGFQTHIHAIGDRAVRVALDAIERADEANGPRDRRPVVAHAQLVDPADRGRLRRLRVIVNAQPLWAQTDPAMEVLTVPRLGAERSLTQYPWATLEQQGTLLSFGSDWPVSSADPLQGMAVGCSRQTSQRQPPGGWTPGERLTVRSAFAAYTAGSAYQAFRRAGSLRVGNDADLVTLDRDPFSLGDPRDLDRLRVTGTWRRGRILTGRDEPIDKSAGPGEVGQIPPS